MDARKIGEVLIRRVKEYVQPVLDQLVDRIAETKTALLYEMDRRFSAIENAKQLSEEDVTSIVERAVSNSLEAIPPAKDGEDGKSVTIEEVTPVISRFVDEAVSRLPKAKDGTSVTVDDVEPLIREAIEKAVSSLPPAKDGQPGKSVTLDDVRPLIAEAVKEIPPPKDGMSVTVEDVRPLLQGMVDAMAKTAVETAILRVPKPERGEKGESVTLDDIRPLVDEAVKQIPIPKDGKSVTVDDVRPLIEQAVKAIPAPKDGTSVTLSDLTPVIEAAVVKAQLDVERRGMDTIQRCIDRIEKPKDGSDGMGFDDMDVIHDGERTFTIRLIRGEKVKEFPFKIPALIERGVFRDGTQYERGDGVTAGGSYWIALKDTKLRPGDNNSDWRLAVKKGRDGKDFVPIRSAVR